LKPWRGADGPEWILCEAFDVFVERVGPPHPVEDEVVEGGVVLEVEVKLVGGQVVDEEFERGYPMKVDDPVGPFADVFFEWHVGVGLVEQRDVWRVLVPKIVNTLICSNDNEEFGITVETSKLRF